MATFFSAAFLAVSVYFLWHTLPISAIPVQAFLKDFMNSALYSHNMQQFDVTIYPVTTGVFLQMHLLCM
jgi:hypothetical protein